MIGERRRPIEHLALLVRSVLDLMQPGGCDRLRLGEAEPWAARIGEIAEGQELHAVTRDADLAVDLEAALQLPFVVFPEWPGERPCQPRRRFGFLLLRGGGAARKRGEGDGEEDGSKIA